MLPTPDDCANSTKFPRYVPRCNLGRVCKVYDGDTFTILAYNAPDRHNIYRFSVRIRGIDCPEIRGKCEEEKKWARCARDWVRDCMQGKVVVLKNIDLDKYGRVLADVQCNEIDVAKKLIELRYAVGYNGGTKVAVDWADYCDCEEAHDARRRFEEEH